MGASLLRLHGSYDCMAPQRAVSNQFPIPHSQFQIPLTRCSIAKPEHMCYNTHIEHMF